MTIAYSILILGVIGIVAAILLYIAAKKFHVDENPKIAEVEELLPGANCGGCGYSGCHAFAAACAEATSMEGLNCVSLNAEGMKKIADLLGFTATAAQRKVAVLKCNSTCETRRAPNRYDGVSSCAIEASLYQGESECVYGCLGCGDCVTACPFGAMSLDKEGAFPVTDWDKCVGCGKCTDACPRGLIELAPLGEHPIVWVACANRDKGPQALKACDVSCIGCGKCIKVCPEKAPSVTSFLAHIDYDRCTACGACVDACPRKSITESATCSPGPHTP